MADLNQVKKKLKDILGTEQFRDDPASTAEYSVNGRTPKAVVHPGNVQQLAAVVALAGEANLALLPWGGGSKIDFGPGPKRLDLVVGARGLNRILDFDAPNLTLTAEAGTEFKDLQTALANGKHSCYLPLDPPFADRATIGGILACNSTGPRRLLYGRPRDVVLGVRFVTPSGETIRAGGKTVKNVSGYDISKLMIGSAGTLGIICETTLRLLPRPESMGTIICSFKTPPEATAMVDMLLDSGLLPAAVEIMSPRALEWLPVQHGASPAKPAFHVVVGLEGFCEAVTRMHTEINAMAAMFGQTRVTYLEENEHSDFWLAFCNLEDKLTEKYAGLLALRLSFPIAEREEMAAFAEEMLTAAGMDHLWLIHAGSGVALIKVLAGSETELETAGALELTRSLLDRCRERGGNLVVERIPATLRERLPSAGAPGSDYPIMKRIKQELDPQRIMNPGRLCGDL